jgi:uncharacterized membrane protein
MLTRRWRVPVVCALAACAYLGIFLAQGKLALALAASGIMLGYGAVLLLLRGRSDTAAVLSEYRVDERRQQINQRAAWLSVNVAAVAAITGGLAQIASGHDPGAWGIMCVVIAVSYLAGIVFYSHRT